MPTATDWASRQTTFSYDLASRLKSITRPNGSQRVLNYDAAGQTTNIVEQTASGNVIAFFKLN
jgi:YD repeat-containing protein